MRDASDFGGSLGTLDVFAAEVPCPLCEQLALRFEVVPLGGHRPASFSPGRWGRLISTFNRG